MRASKLKRKKNETKLKQKLKHERDIFLRGKTPFYTKKWKVMNFKVASKIWRHTRDLMNIAFFSTFLYNLVIN